jgi:hypothetical protein
LNENIYYANYQALVKMLSQYSDLLAFINTHVHKVKDDENKKLMPID